MKTNDKSFSLKSAGCCALVLAAATLIGCDNSGGGASSAAAPARPAKLTGIVLNANGPINDGTVEATDAKGAKIANTPLSGGNKYTISLPATASYPVVLTAKPKDESPSAGAPVKAVVTSSLAEKMDITTVSTLVVDNAMELGGLTPSNIEKASIGAIGQRQSRGVSAGAGGSTGGPGNSGGGIGQGGHGGHDMKGMGGDGETDKDKMENMSH